MLTGKTMLVKNVQCFLEFFHFSVQDFDRIVVLTIQITVCEINATRNLVYL